MTTARKAPATPRLIHKDGRFFWFGQPQNKHLPHGAGFRYHPQQFYWWTDDPQVAAKLFPYADGLTKLLLREYYARLRGFYPESAEAVEAAAAELAAEEAAQQALEASRATDAALAVPVPEGLEYMPFQKAGIAYALRRFEEIEAEQGGVLIADEMGLGKTVQAAGIINALSDHLVNILVVCPASLKINWRRELERWLVNRRWVNIVSQYFPAGASVRIINYDRLHKYEKALRATAWDLVIFDESHLLKNPEARRSKHAYAIPAKRLVMLTGTPIVNRPMELYPLVNALAPGTFGEVGEFQRRYHYASLNPRTRRNQQRLAELQDKLRSTVMVRRLKKDVLKDLPPKRRQVIELDPEGAGETVKAEMAEVARWMQEMFALRLAVELGKASESDEEYAAAVAALRDALAESQGAISRLRHATALAKVPAVTAFLREVLESSGKVVLFGHHRDVLEAYREAFGKQAVLLYGGMAMEERQRSVDRFQQEPSVKVFVGSIQAAGVGLTLTAASHVIFAELDWVPGNMSQAEDRCHRIGQAESVLVQHLVFEDSLDATMAKKLVEKQKVIEQALDLEKGELGAAPLVPMEEGHATANVTRARIKAEAERLTAEQMGEIAAAARQVQPTNPLDAALLERLGTKTPRQAALARRIVRKYAPELLS